MTETSTLSSNRLLVWRGVLIILALLVCWQAIRMQMAEHFARNADVGIMAAADTALWWDAAHPGALENKARQVLSAMGEESNTQSLEQAASLLRLSIAGDPSKAIALSNLAMVEIDQSLPEVAASTAALADRLAPVEPRVQRNLALVAFKREQLDQAVMHIARAMVGAPATAGQYFPMLLQVAVDPKARAVLQVIATDPRPFPWWSSFFSYVAANAQTLDALRGLVALRESSTAWPLQEYERERYIGRLRKEGLIAEAYLHWVNGLTPEQLLTLGYLYDGSFEHSFRNGSGFGWVAIPPQNSGIRVSLGDSYGVSGDQALRLSFRGKRVRFSHIYQHLFLSPGSYTVSGRVRPDQLMARRGLQWRVYCSAGAAGTLGESELFSSTGDWRTFDFEVAVPPDCAGQVLRLYSAGNRDVDHELKGAIWFDDMQIGLNK